MKFKELLTYEKDIDVYNDVMDDEGWAICPPVVLTDEGLAEFGALMELDVDIEHDSYGDIATVLIDKLPNWKKLRRLLNSFLSAQAGYCSEELFDKWFEEVA